jgi:hypothetical protein
MFEQTSRLAEKLAVSVSRRGFLGSLSGWAAATAMGVAGLLTGAATARAGMGVTCCYYNQSGGGFCGVFKACVKEGDPCPPPASSCIFAVSYPAEHCKQC